MTMLKLKCRYQMAEAEYDEWSSFIQKMIPKPNSMPQNFYRTKKFVRGLGLPVEVIDCCENLCMIYWGKDSELISCKICNKERYKPVREGPSKRSRQIPYKKMYYFPITPRLQRLYASKATAGNIHWHLEHVQEEGQMCHPSDSPAWKHFDSEFPEFANEVRNVRLKLCANGFQPFVQSGQQYSSWLVIVTPYNLPPSIYMKDEFIFLIVLCPGPRNPKGRIDVFLQPLIAELN